MGAVEGQPLTHDLDQPASTSATTQAGAGPRTRHPRPTKTTDPAKQQRQLHHKQTVIMAAERRKQLGPVRAVLGLPTILEDPIPSNPNTDQQLHNAELPQTNQEEPPTIPPARPDDD
jgi:hypothetical protein